MSFDLSAGTRGARMPKPGLFPRVMSRVLVGLHRRQGYRFQGMDVLVLSTMGAKSGEPRRTPLAWYPSAEDSWIVVGSYGGAQRNPSWVHNIAAHPDDVAIELRGRIVPVRAEQLHGLERERAWNEVVAAQPRYAAYQGKTDRLIPVIRLTATTS